MPTTFRNLTPYSQRHLVSNNNTTLFEWFTGWLSCDGVDYVRAVLKAQNATSNNFNWQLAIQSAAVRADNPGTPTALGAQPQTGSGEYQTTDIDVTSYTAGKRLFRLGIAYSSANASVQQADVGLQASWKQLGTDLGSRRVTLATVDNGAKYEVLTPWIPATFMTKVKAAFILTSLTNTNQVFRYKLAYQTAGTKVEQPGSWTDAETFVTVPNGQSYDERNTGECTLSTTNMWFRLGVAYDQSGAGVDSNITAVLDAACSCR